jgi:hypothetical protein
MYPGPKIADSKFHSAACNELVGRITDINVRDRVAFVGLTQRVQRGFQDGPQISGRHWFSDNPIAVHAIQIVGAIAAFVER